MVRSQLSLLHGQDTIIRLWREGKPLASRSAYSGNDGCRDSRLWQALIKFSRHHPLTAIIGKVFIDWIMLRQRCNSRRFAGRRQHEQMSRCMPSQGRQTCTSKQASHGMSDQHIRLILRQSPDGLDQALHDLGKFFPPCIISKVTYLISTPLQPDAKQPHGICRTPLTMDQENIHPASTQIGKHIRAVVIIPGARPVERIEIHCSERRRSNRQCNRHIKSLLTGKTDASFACLIRMLVTKTSPAFDAFSQ